MLRTSTFQEICKKESLGLEIARLNRILNDYPDNVRSLEELGIIYYYQKKDEEAIEIYQKLKELEPDNADIRAVLGFLYYEVDRLDEAIEELNVSLDITPNSPFVLFMLGNTYSRAGKVREAVDCYDLAIFLDFDIQKAHLDFAKKYEDIGRDKKALREYRAASTYVTDDEEITKKIKKLEKKIKEKVDE